MMMAYNNNNSNNPGSFAPFDSSQVDGKLDCNTNFMATGLAAQMQPGIEQNLGAMGIGNNSMQGNQGLNYAKIQPTVNFQSVMNSQSMNNNLNNLNANNSMQFQPTTTLMNSMNMRPFFGSSAPFGLAQAANQPQQLAIDIPTYITTNARPRVDPNPLSFMGTANCFQPSIQKTLPQHEIPSVININANDAVAGLNTFSSTATSTLEKDMTEHSNSLLKSALRASLKESPKASIPRSNSKTKRLLPADFEPSSTSIICGNKRKYFESKGNMRFRQVCDMFTQDYVSAPTKIEKSAVVSKVMNILRADCPDGVCFVTPVNGRWYAVSERTAREKVGTYLRDCLSGHYLSSAKNKIARRKMSKKELAAASACVPKNQIIPPTTAPAPAPFAVAGENKDEDGSMGSVSFYDVDDLTPVPL